MGISISVSQLTLMDQGGIKKSHVRCIDTLVTLGGSVNKASCWGKTEMTKMKQIGSDIIDQQTRSDIAFVSWEPKGDAGAQRSWR